MSRTKGSPKTGGRKKGTPNRNTAILKECITDTLTAYLQGDNAGTDAPTLQGDFAAMAPAERVRAAAQLVGYVIPKQQAVSVEEQTQIEAAALTQWLESAPDEAINAVAAKVLEMQARNANNNIC